MTPDEVDHQPTRIEVEAALQLGPDLGDYNLLYLDVNGWVDLGGEALSVDLVESDGARSVIEISVGGKQPGFSGPADAHTSGVVSGRLEIIGETMQIKS